MLRTRHTPYKPSMQICFTIDMYKQHDHESTLQVRYRFYKITHVSTVNGIVSRIWQFALIGDQRNKKRKEYACWRSCRQTSKAAAQNMLIKRTVLHMRDSKMYCPAAGFAMQILKKGKEKHAPFCANLMRSQALYRAAQVDTEDKLSD